eukprot:TRINITY_DN3522_c0_g2_i5.p1 TRINITY_DN3522_c0_g2~~TRINITY_DN3522_c0_g2_i5.p1  ORF type:complete len:129 (+),score=25.78 TRINITY_DN3522_c0_g2_i5:143-529(+)
MNLNYSNVDVGSLTPEIREKYAFPEDKQLIHKFLDFGNTNFTKSEAKEVRSEVGRLVIGSSALIAAGFVTYCYLLMPNGQVVRNILRQSEPRAVRAFKRFAPFAGLLLPLYAMRAWTESKKAPNYRAD